MHSTVYLSETNCSSVFLYLFFTFMSVCVSKTRLSVLRPPSNGSTRYELNANVSILTCPQWKSQHAEVYASKLWTWTEIYLNGATADSNCNKFHSNSSQGCWDLLPNKWFQLLVVLEKKSEESQYIFFLYGTLTICTEFNGK